MRFSENVSKMDCLQNLADQHPENSFCISVQLKKYLAWVKTHFKMNHFHNVKFTSSNERLRSYKPLNSICQRNRELVCPLTAIASLEMNHTHTPLHLYLLRKLLPLHKPNSKCETISKINANTY